MGSGYKEKGLVRSVLRLEHPTVEAATLRPSTDGQPPSFSAKLLDALTVEMDDVVRDLLARDRFTPLFASRSKAN
jgi:hypothetical protein